jgi:hypothetical protein
MLCERQGGVYQGAGIDCEIDAVDCTRGACCEMDGSCRDNTVCSSCSAAGAEFGSGFDCAGITCELRGACCKPGECTEETRASCLVAGGTYQGPGELCEVDTCPPIPLDCAIDARQPTNSTGDTTFGWDSVAITFGGDACGLTIGDFTVEVIPGPCDDPSCEVPGVVGVTTSGNAATLELDPPIPPGQWTCFTHDETNTRTCLGFLPGDVDGDGTSLAADILRLINCLNGNALCDEWQCDLDRSGLCAPADILRGVDLLNGADPYEPWLDRSLDPCPSNIP